MEDQREQPHTITELSPTLSQYLEAVLAIHRELMDKQERGDEFHDSS